MQSVHDNTQGQCHHVKMDTAGRIVVPAGIRHRLGVDPGDTLVLKEEDGGIRIQTLSQIIAESQAYFRKFIPKGVSLVDELTAERRAEAERE